MRQSCQLPISLGPAWAVLPQKMQLVTTGTFGTLVGPVPLYRAPYISSAWLRAKVQLVMVGLERPSLAIAPPFMASLRANRQLINSGEQSKSLYIAPALAVAPVVDEGAGDEGRVGLQVVGDRPAPALGEVAGEGAVLHQRRLLRCAAPGQARVTMLYMPAPLEATLSQMRQFRTVGAQPKLSTPAPVPRPCELSSSAGFI